MTIGSGTTTVNGPWVMFLDMLGTKDSAKLSELDYPSKLSLFKTHVTNIAKSLDCNIKMRLFSDSVYLEIDNFDEAVFFCRELMKRCFPEDIFFKGAVTEGQLNEETVSLENRTKSGHSIEISGSTFGPSVVSVYYAQEEFKGIGFRYIGDLRPEQGGKHLIRSAFPIVNSRLKIDWIQYYDLSIYMAPKPEENESNPSDYDTAAELENYNENVAFIEAVVSAALRSERSSSNLSRYYISFLHSIITSSDFTKIDVADDTWISYPAVFQVLEVNPGFKTGIRKIVGADSLYLHLFSEICHQRKDASDRSLINGNSLSYISDKLVASLNSNKVARRSFPKIPSCFATPESLAFLAKKEVEFEVRRQNHKSRS